VTTLATNLLWILLLAVTFLLPLWRQRRIEATRIALMRELQEIRGSRVIALVHRQELMSLLGFLFSRHITIEDSEQILRAIRLTPEDTPIDLIVHTPGGLVLAAEQIARAIKAHKARTTVLVPHYAMSGGTMLALAADEIIMDENAVLGPVDPQIGAWPAASILAAAAQKDKNRLEDQTLILADVAAKAMRQVKETVREILEPKLDEADARRLAEVLTEGRWTHDYPITYRELQGFGLTVSTRMPKQVYELMELYRQPPSRRPSVQYVPAPYPPPTGRPEGDEAGR
jgi:ClpP class serine protease